MSTATVDTQNTTNVSFFKVEEQKPGWKYSIGVNKVLYSGKSKYQDIQVLSTPVFDRVLVVDNLIQSSSKDEFIYHESMVHPAMLSHAHPRKVFIGGGGEMATAREVLKYDSVEKLVVCDLDEEVIAVCKKHLPSMYGADDPRCQIVIQDAKAYLEACADGEFDVILMDICDPIEAGPGIVCYFEEFYKLCKEKLSANGVLVTQSTACSLILHGDCFSVIVNTIKKVFDDVLPYSSYVPSFYSEWSWTLAFKAKQRPRWLSQAEGIDAQLDKCLGKEKVEALGYYDGQTHMGMISLPKFLRRALAHEKRVMTKDMQFCMYHEQNPHK